MKKKSQAENYNKKIYTKNTQKVKYQVEPAEKERKKKKQKHFDLLKNKYRKKLDHIFIGRRI